MKTLTCLFTTFLIIFATQLQAAETKPTSTTAVTKAEAAPTPAASAIPSVVSNPIPADMQGKADMLNALAAELRGISSTLTQDNAVKNKAHKAERAKKMALCEKLKKRQEKSTCKTDVSKWDIEFYNGMKATAEAAQTQVAVRRTRVNEIIALIDAEKAKNAAPAAPAAAH